jgi:hypothetical protein
LRNVEQLGCCVALFGQGVAKHGITERASRGDGFGARGYEFGCTNSADALTGFFSEEGESSASPAAETALMASWRLDELPGGLYEGAGLIVNVAIAAQVAGVVKDDACGFVLGDSRG